MEHMRGAAVRPLWPWVVWRMRGCVALASNQILLPSQEEERRPAAGMEIAQKETDRGRRRSTTP
jgi:hypothetical protein